MEKYIVQKTQKIVSALYLVTDLIKDSEALKWEIREEGVSLVSNVLVLNTTLPGEREHANVLINLSIEKLVSYLNISLISSIISKMNATIIISEMEALKNFINKNSQEIQLPGYILSDSFFQTDMPVPHTPEPSFYKTGVLRTSNKANNQLKNDDVKDKKNSRQESILQLLRKDSKLTIKDFAKAITDCSEKTIQRELILLVEKGLVKKEGERRWSTYSLVTS